jgi:GNAT superfamily N-acetyltransferase
VSTALNIVAFVVGCVGIGGILASRQFLARWLTNHTLMRFTPSGDLDIVLSSYEPPESAPGQRSNPASFDSQLVAFGYAKTASVLARVAGESGYRKALKLQLADLRESSLAGDLVLIGGTRGHDLAFDYLQHLREAYPTLKLHFNDECETNNYMILGKHAPFTYNWCVEADKRVPRYDLALVVLWINPYARSRRRSILCAGNTSYGTLAATEFVVGDGLSAFWKEHRRTFSDVVRRRRRFGAFPSRLSPLRWPHVAMVVKFTIPDGSAEVLHHKVLKDGRRHAHDHVTLEMRLDASLSAEERRSIGAMLATGFPGLEPAEVARGWIQAKPAFRILALSGGGIIAQLSVADLEGQGIHADGGPDSTPRKPGWCLGIGDLIVRSEHRGKGLARFLIESAIAESRRRDACLLMVASGPEVGLRHIFELQGFEPTAHRVFVERPDGSRFENPAWMYRAKTGFEVPDQIQIKSDF